MVAISYSKTDKAASDYRQGWSQIFGKYQGTLYLTPTEAKAVIFQYAPSVRISAVLPAKTRSLSLEYYKHTKVTKHEIAVPEVVISQLLYERSVICGDYRPCICSDCKTHHSITCHCDICQSDPVTKLRLTADIYYLYLSNLTANSINYGNSGLPNVYPDGKICFGHQTPPTNLRQANSKFWGSIFNNDFGLVSCHHTGCMNGLRHSYYGHWTVRKGHNGNCRRQVVHQCQPCGCHKVVPDPLQHLYNCPQMPNCQILSGCKCICACCTGSCQCVCRCDCCRNVCSCPCSCNRNYDFAESFKLSFVRNTPNNDGKVEFFGTGFIATQKSIDAIFVSTEPSFLAKVNSLYHRKLGLRKTPAVIGFARMVADQEWEINLEDGKNLLLGSKEVVVA